MTDKELLMYAAKAAGLQFDDGRAIDPMHFIARPIGSTSHEDWDLWNPLVRDRDALRLVVKLNLALTVECENSGSVTVEWDIKDSGDWTYSVTIDAPINGDDYAATRLAIVTAAAEIGKAMT